MAEPEPLVGASGHRYHLETAPLARGGQGAVWGAMRDDGLAVVLKLADDTRGSREALNHEADLLEQLTALQTPGVVHLLDRVEQDGRPGMVLPRYEEDANACLARRVAEAGGVAVEVILAFAADIARALGALHRAEIAAGSERASVLVHRDVKPENILVDADGGVRLIDLGGSLVVDVFQAVRLAVFGSPLWAPFDQILPGLPEPNPTWDTYALCVVLFQWLTDSRPSYQADPSPMLTPRGRACWEALCALARADGIDHDALRAAHLAFQEQREGTVAADLVDVRGHAAIQAEDLTALELGLARLADARVYGEEGAIWAARDLATLLGRGLSPLSHPSPPNRFWDAIGLAEEIDGVRARLASTREARRAARERQGLEARLAEMEGRLLPVSAVLIDREIPSEEEGLDPVPRALRPARAGAGRPLGPLFAGLGIGVILLAVLSIPFFYGLSRWWSARADGPARISGGAFPFGDTVGDGAEDERPVRTATLAPFLMDRTEVAVKDWRACQAAGACGALAWMDPGSPYAPGGAKDGVFRGLTGENQPAVGVTLSQATALCAWRGGRLPSEEEWEMAATWGPSARVEADKQRWPWGPANPDCVHANSEACSRNTTLQVDSLPDGAGAWGVLNLAGNALEWTSSRYPVPSEASHGLFRKRARSSETQYVLRGGAYDAPVSALRPTARRHDDPAAVSPSYGFRCVYDPA